MSIRVWCQLLTPSRTRIAITHESLSRLKLSALLLIGSTCLQAAVLQGVVVENRSGRPLSRTRVTIESAGHGGRGGTVWTGPGGEFRATGLDAGAYIITAQRTGYSPAKFGQKHWKAAGTPVVLRSDGFFTAELRLRKLAAINGEVTDDNKVALAGIAIYAYRSALRPKLAAATQTDDNGAFRLAGLEPGRYLIRTNARQLEDGSGLLPTFYGQTADPAEARTVQVALDEEVGGLSITPIPGRLATLSGRITGAIAATIYLHGDMIRRETQADANGAFQFTQLSPGTYDVLADSGTGKSAYRRISIAGEQENTALELAASPVLRLRCSDVDGSGLDTKAISVFFRRRVPAEEASRQMTCGGVGTLSPGTWEIAAAPPPNLFVARLDETRLGAEGYEIQFSAGEVRELTIAFSRYPAVLKGKVLAGPEQPAIGAPVYVVPLDPELRSRSGGVRSLRADAKGEFQAGGLAPGRYEVISSYTLGEIDDGVRPVGEGITVTLGEGVEETIEIRIKDS